MLVELKTWLADFFVELVGVILLFITYIGQRKISQKQDKRQYSQQFESTLFNLLDQQRNILLNLKGNVPDGFDSTIQADGEKYVFLLRADLSKRLLELNYEPELLSDDNKNLLKVKVNDIYSLFFQEHSSQLGHYFRHLYHILKYIDDSQNEDKKKYTDLCQSQLNTDELYLCAINGISNFGRKKMLPLLDKYSFLENLFVDSDELIMNLVGIFYPSIKLKKIINMEKNIIFLGGVHAVGKTTFSNIVKQDNPIIRTESCSNILKWKDPKEKEVEDIPANQNRLANNLRHMIDVDVPYLLDGHFCLLNKDREIERVALETFEAINPVFIILLTERVDILEIRLQKRDGKKYDRKKLELMVEEERKWAEEVAAKLSVKIYEIKATEYDRVKDTINEFVNSFKV